MKAVVFEDVGKIRVDDLPDPEVEEATDAIVRITTAAICGSDLHMFRGKTPLLPGDPIGHEGMGIVEKVGSDVSRFAPGDRVVIAFNIVDGTCWFCRKGQTSLCENYRNLGAGIGGGNLGGTQAEYVRVPAAEFNLLRIPDELEDERYLFIGDVLTTGFYAAAIAGIEPGDTVAVVGAGPVGFFAAQSAAIHDPARIVVLDLEPDRLALVERLGMTTINPKDRNPQTAVTEMTDGRGADVVIEAVGSTPAFETAFDVVRRGGTVSIVGQYVTESIDLQLGMLWMRMLRIVMSGFCPIPVWWERALAAVTEGKIDPLPLVSHTLPLEEAPKGYDLFERREATKVVLKP